MWEEPVFLEKRLTDSDVFFRAAWAVRTGGSLYDIVETHGWHYNYPPFFAIAMAPLANPPPGGDRSGMLPYGLSVALWYWISFACLVAGVHWLASAVESKMTGPFASRPPAGCERWWNLRVIPVLVCLPTVGHTLSRGQVNLVLVMLLCGAAALLSKKRGALAGVCLAATTSIKVFPAFLGLYPVWRRDWRCLAGFAAGLVLFLGLIPTLVLGPSRTFACSKKFEQVMIAPALGGGGDQSRANELMSVTSNDLQSFMAVIHNTLNPFQQRWERPKQIPPWVRRTHWGLALLFTATTLWFARRPRTGDFTHELLFFGCLIALMIPISPASHNHYYVLVLPLVMALVAHNWEKNGLPRLSRGMVALLTTHTISIFLGILPGFRLVSELGGCLYTTLILWAAGILAMQERSVQAGD